MGSRYWLVLLTGPLVLCCLCWRTSIIRLSPSVVAKASIEVDLSLPSPSIISQRLFSNASRRQTSVSRSHHANKKRHHGPVSRFMIQLYNRRPNADIVKALKPSHVSSSSVITDNQEAAGTILEFQIPAIRSRENLERAELLGRLGTIVRVCTIDQLILSDVRRSRKSEDWRAFDVTSLVNEKMGEVVKLLVSGRVDRTRLSEEGPILVLSYAKPGLRKSRAVQDEEHEDGAAPWIQEGGRRVRRRNLCRRRPLYVDFASIAYDEWVVAPPGYEAYQCVGKCFYPFGDHLSPTKHAIVQTLVHGALQGENGANGKPVGRACCVPTRLAPTSLLYIDASGTLTYQYGYEDMVVAECGCR